MATNINIIQSLEKLIERADLQTQLLEQIHIDIVKLVNFSRQGLEQMKGEAAGSRSVHGHFMDALREDGTFK